jgi:hypothetical protein
MYPIQSSTSGYFGTPEEPMIKKSKKTGRKLREKTRWHRYSLQSLGPSRFIYVVDKILNRDFVLVK